MCLKGKKMVCMLSLAVAISMTACEQKPVEIKSEKVQEETEKKTTEEAKPIDNQVELTDDIYAFQMSVNGKVIKFPMTYAEFVKYGWSYQGDEDASISADATIMSEWFKKDKDQTIAYLTNFDDQNIPLQSSYVTGIILSKDYILGEDSKVVLPNGIEMGMSTQEDVTRCYGSPTDTVEDPKFPMMTYELASKQLVTLTFDKMNGDILSEIFLKNEVQPDDFEMNEGSYEMPDAIADYHQPELISTNLFDYTFSFDDALYQMPAPLFEYILNGWSLVEDKSDVLVESGKTGKVTLRKGQQMFLTNVINLGENTDEVLNCFVTSLAANVKDCNVQMEISGGIKMGMEQEQLEKMIAPYEYKKEVSNYTYYEITDPDQKDCGYEVIVKNGKVTGIEIDRKNLQ